VVIVTFNPLMVSADELIDESVFLISARTLALYESVSALFFANSAIAAFYYASIYAINF
jgi:hypothetical protein